MGKYTPDRNTLSLFDGKTCFACGDWFLIAEGFYGKSAYCKACHSQKSSDWARKNKAKRSVKFKDRYQEDAEFREQLKQNSLQYYHNLQTTDPERKRAYRRKWRNENPDKERACKQRRRGRISGNGGSFTPEEWQALCKQYDHRCLRCGRQEPQIKLCADHVISLIHGGTSNIDNIQPLCQPCNCAKHDRTIDYRK